MDEQPKKSAGATLAWIVVLLLLSVLLLLYPIGYFVRCQVSWLIPPTKGGAATFSPAAPAAGPAVMVRNYPTDWEAQFFRPAAHLETLLRGNGVHTASPGKIW